MGFHLKSQTVRGFPLAVFEPLMDDGGIVRGVFMVALVCSICRRDITREVKYRTYKHVCSCKWSGSTYRKQGECPDCGKLTEGIASSGFICKNCISPTLQTVGQAAKAPLTVACKRDTMEKESIAEIEDLASQTSTGSSIDGKYNVVGILFGDCTQKGRVPPKKSLVSLVRDPENSYDKNAIRVEWGGYLVGYISRACNQELAAYLTKGAQCIATVVESYVSEDGVLSSLAIDVRLVSE